MLFWIASLSVLLAVELVFAGSIVSAIFPPKAAPLTATLFDLYRQQIIPERDIFFLRFLIVVSIGLFCAGMYLKPRFSGARFGQFKMFTLFQAVVVAAQAFCGFKLLVFREQIWLNAFYVVLGLSILGKIFWPELAKVFQWCHARLKNPVALNIPQVWGMSVGMGVVALLIWVPDVEGALAKIFLGEQFHHLDFFLVPAAWAHTMGNVLGIDTISRYGIGAPAVIGDIGRLVFGQFSYKSALIVLMALSVAYFWLWFITAKKFFGHLAFGLLVVLAGIRLQLFQNETLPFIFTYPQVTPMRVFFDALLFMVLAWYIQKPSFKTLGIGAAICGIAIYWITGEGLYLLCAFYGFLLLREWYAYTSSDNQFKPLSNQQRVLLFGIPWVVMFAAFVLTVGRHAIGAEFWANQLEYIRFYQAGHGSAPMINNLVPGFILQAGWAFVLPVVYVLGLILTVGAIIEKKIKAEGLVIAAALIYLLADFHYQAMVSNNTTAYLRKGMIMAFIAGYALHVIIKNKSVYVRRLSMVLLAGGIAVSFVTNHQFLIHPNVFNFSRNPMSHPPVSHNPIGRANYFNHLFTSYPDQFKLKINSIGEENEYLVTEANVADDRQLKEFYLREINYAKDADLIKELTKTGDKVAVISSFETSILMQANRAPFFYTQNLVNSRPRRMRTFSSTLLYTVDNLKKELARLDGLKPDYVFVEKIFLTPEFPQAYLRDSQDLIMLMQQVLLRYEPYKAGEYLMALKRKDT